MAAEAPMDRELLAKNWWAFALIWLADWVDAIATSRGLVLMGWVPDSMAQSYPVAVRPDLSATQGANERFPKQKRSGFKTIDVEDSEIVDRGQCGLYLQWVG